MLSGDLLPWLLDRAMEVGGTLIIEVAWALFATQDRSDVECGNAASYGPDSSAYTLRSELVLSRPPH